MSLARSESSAATTMYRRSLSDQPGPYGSGSFTVILDRQNRILGEHWQGSLPQFRL